MNTILSTGYQGMQSSAATMQRSAHAIASANSSPPNTTLPQGGPTSDQDVGSVRAPNAVPAVNPAANVEKPTMDLTENILKVQQSAQIFTASAAVVKVGDEVMGSLIDDYS